MDEFLKYQRKNFIKSDDAFSLIINKLMMKNARGSDKISDLDEFDSESNFGGKIYIGHIYIFEYLTNQISTYKDIEYTDHLPIVLITGWTQNIIRGINFNFCNKALKTIILNLLQNMDSNFFEKDAQIQAENKLMPISKNIYSFLIERTSEKQIIEYLNRVQPNVDYLMIFRNYSISNIKNIRMIEPWQWKYIPNLTYDGSIKSEILNKILTLSGIKNIKI